jgi:hypothetical protein
MLNSPARSFQSAASSNIFDAITLQVSALRYLGDRVWPYDGAIELAPLLLLACPPTTASSDPSRRYGACWLRLFRRVHCFDLLEDRHQIEVVAEHLDLAVLDLDHLDRLDRHLLFVGGSS